MIFRKNRQSSDKTMGPEEQAAHWFARMHSSQVSQSVVREFETWLAETEDHARAYEKVQRFWGASRTLIEELTPLDLTAGHSIRATSFYYRLAAIAASLFLVVSFSATIAWLIRIPPPIATPPVTNSDATTRALVSDAEYSTNAKNRSSIALSDGSLVVLNKDSEIRVTYSTSERAITLVRGQALFEVAKHQKRPFLVYAGDRRVVATGTAFDVSVNSLEKSVEVTLVEGSVFVDQPSASPMASRVRTKLDPGERLIARAGLPPQILQSSEVTNWRTDRMIFSDSPLRTVVTALNRYGGAQILLGDEKLGELRVEGTLRTDDPAAVAHAIAEIYSLRITEENPQIIRLVWK